MTFEKDNSESLITQNNYRNNNHNKNNNNHVVIVPAITDKVVNNEKKLDQHENYEPPDGTFRGYLVMICAFMCNGILFGIINTYSVIYMSLQRQLKESGDELASSKACEYIVSRIFIAKILKVCFLMILGVLYHFENISTFL